MRGAQEFATEPPANLPQVRMGPLPVLPEYFEVRIGAGADSPELFALEDHALVVEVGRQDEHRDLDWVESIQGLSRHHRRHKLGDPQEVRFVVESVLRVQGRESFHPIPSFLAEIKHVLRELLRVLILLSTETRVQLIPQVGGFQRIRLHHPRHEILQTPTPTSDIPQSFQLNVLDDELVVIPAFAEFAEHQELVDRSPRSHRP